MTKKENARYDAAERGSLFLTTYDVQLMAIVLYAVLKVKYFDLFDKLTQARLKQIEQTGDITALKKALKSIMINTIYKFMLRASVQAFNLDKPDLAVSLGKPLVYLTQGSDNDAVAHCTDMRKIMSDNATTLDVIEPADLDAMEAAIKAFKLVLAKPKAKIKAKKAEGTNPIPGLLNDLDVIIDKIGKLILSYLPQLSATWVSEMKVGKPSGIRHTSLALLSLDAATGTALPKVKVTLKKGSKTIVKYSTKRGWIRAFNLESGNYDITIQHETIQTVHLTDIGVNNKRVVKLEVRLLKIKTPDDTQVKTGGFLITTVDEITNNPVLSLTLTIPALNRVIQSDSDAQFFADALIPAIYDATITGDNIITKPIAITIQPNQQTELTIPVQLNPTT